MKRMVSIIAVTMLTIALTACGGSSQAATTDTQAAENSAPAVAEEQKETAEAAEQTEARRKKHRKQFRKLQQSLQVKHLPRLIRMSWSHISLLPALLKALQSVSLL